MITPKDAKSRIEEDNPDREVKAIAEYEGKYLIAAPGKGIGAEDTSDAFFLMDKKSGETTGFIPSLDIIGFQRAMANPIATF